jgi:DNA-binding transcriptional MerR regulator
MCYYISNSEDQLMTTVPKIKYLTNKDLLLEIHRSKNTYCSYTQPEYADYDIILPSLEKINIRTIAEAKRNRAAKLSKEAHAKAQLTEKKASAKDYEVDYKKVAKTDLVFRITCWEHIPLAPGRKKTVKSTADNHEKINFPPFQHWKFDDNDNLICVGKSHWKGGLQNGHFSKEHGRMTDNLARMFIKLCERYATRGNVRGYTYNDEMRGQAILQLTQIGLQFDESKSNNPFAYYTAAVTNSFVRIINIEKRNQNIRDDILEMNGMNPSWTRQNSGKDRNEAPIITSLPPADWGGDD